MPGNRSLKAIATACVLVMVLGACGSNSSEQQVTEVTPVQLTRYSDAAGLAVGTEVEVESGSLRLSGDDDATLCLSSSDSLPPVCNEEEFTLRGVDSSMNLIWEWQDSQDNPVDRETGVTLTGRLLSPGVIDVESIANIKNLATPTPPAE